MEVSQATLGMLLILGAAVALVPALNYLAGAVKDGDWDWSSWLIVLLASAPSLGKVIGELTAPSQRVVSFTTGESKYLEAPIVSQMSAYLTAAAVLVSAVLAAHFLIKRGRVSKAVLAALALWLWAAGATYASGYPWPVLQGVALGAALLAASAARNPRAVCAAVAAVGLTAALTSAVTVLVQPLTAASVCRTDKCGVLGWLMTGSLGNENELGLLMAAAIPFLAIYPRGRGGWFLAWYLAAMVAATGSRTATFAAAVTLVAALAFRPKVEQPRPTRLMTLTAAGLLALGLALPFAGLPPGEFSGRGLIWQLSRDFTSHGPVWGLGTQHWRMNAFDPGAGYSMHNQLFDVVYITGWGGLALFLIMLWSMVRNSGAAGRPALLLLIIGAAGMGLLERPWSIGQLDWLSFTYVAAVMLAVTARERAEGGGDDLAAITAPVTVSRR